MRKLSDKQWNILQPLLPRQDFSKGGKPRVDDKKTVEGILWILTTEHSGMKCLLSMEVEKPVGDALPSGRNKGCGETYGRNSLLSLINRRNSPGKWPI